MLQENLNRTKTQWGSSHLGTCFAMHLLDHLHSGACQQNVSAHYGMCAWVFVFKG